MHDQNIVTFTKSKTKELLYSLGYRFEDNGSVLYHNKIVHCDTCGHEIKIDNVGGVFPGSRKLYCDTDECLIQYVANAE